METRYAVVDLEATSTHLTEGRLIQFSCVFVKNRKIESTFNTYINPKMPIDDDIQRLTGITNAQLREAPYFEEIADYLYQLLSDCVFVAHNVSFDYRFLKKKFKAVGLKAFKLKAIDTVELTQILMPTLPQYRLSEVTKTLGIPHDNPHQADSDAEATARLFLYLEQRACQLPLPLLRQLVKYKQCLTKNTGDFLEECFVRAKENKVHLDPNMTVISNIVLQRPRNIEAVQKSVPIEDYQKIAHYHIQDTPFIEMVPKEEALLALLQTKRHPLVISAASQEMRTCLLHDVIPKLNTVMNQHYRAIEIKEASSYIDLEAFYQSWQEASQPRVVRLLQMRLLVWLSQTTTGDLAELNIKTKQHPYWHVIEHKGLSYLTKRSAFYQYDFLRRARTQAKEADMLVMSHAPLYHENTNLTDCHLLVLETFLFMKRWQHQQEHAISFRPLTQFKWEQNERLLLSKQDQKEWQSLALELEEVLENFKVTMRHFLKACQSQLQSNTFIPYQLAEEEREVIQVCQTTRPLLEQLAVLLEKSHNKRAQSLAWQDEVRQLIQSIDFVLYYLTCVPAHQRYITYDGVNWSLLYINDSGQSLSHYPWMTQVASCQWQGSTLAINQSVDFIASQLGISKEKCQIIEDSTSYQVDVMPLTKVPNTTQQMIVMTTTPERYIEQDKTMCIISPLSLQKGWRQFHTRNEGLLVIDAALWDEVMLLEHDDHIPFIIELPLLSPAQPLYHALKMWQTVGANSLEDETLLMIKQSVITMKHVGVMVEDIEKWQILLKTSLPKNTMIHSTTLKKSCKAFKKA